MGEAISNNNDRVLWDEVRKFSKSSHELPSMMDGITGTEEIANILVISIKHYTTWLAITHKT